MKLISEFTNESEQSIIDNFLVQLWEKFQPKIKEARKTGQFLQIQQNFSVFLRPDLVSGVLNIPLDTPRYQTDNEISRRIKDDFERLEQEKLARKRKWIEIFGDVELE